MENGSTIEPAWVKIGDDVKAKDLLRAIEQAGWTLHRITGSHHIYKHLTLPGRVVIPVHGLNRDVAPGTLLSILKQAGLR